MHIEEGANHYLPLLDMQYLVFPDSWHILAKRGERITFLTDNETVAKVYGDKNASINAHYYSLMQKSHFELLGLDTLAEHTYAIDGKRASACIRPWLPGLTLQEHLTKQVLSWDRKSPLYSNYDALAAYVKALVGLPNYDGDLTLTNALVMESTEKLVGFDFEETHKTGVKTFTSQLITLFSQLLIPYEVVMDILIQANMHNYMIPKSEYEGLLQSSERRLRLGLTFF